MGFDVEIVNDQSIFTGAAVDDVQQSLILAVFLTACVLLFFLRTLRNTFMVLIAIPCSLISTFFVMYLVGFSLNAMSLMALALLIGILVDDSIVVLENINRHSPAASHPWTAALEGRWEIGLAAIAITMTDVVVYLPVRLHAGQHRPALPRVRADHRDRYPVLHDRGVHLDPDARFSAPPGGKPRE